jgi:hypothetical protein
MNLAHGPNRRALSLAVTGLLAVAAGFVGQGSLNVGRPTPSTVSAIVTDVVGGAGSRRPVRVVVSIAVTNSGGTAVRIFGPDRAGAGTDILAITPSPLRVGPGRVGRIDADVNLGCDLSTPLHLADLQLQLTDGTRISQEISGSGRVLEACSRADPAVRPLAATIAAASGGAPTGDRRLTVRFSSPTGRRLDLLAIRAGGADLQMSPTSLTVAGNSPVAVRLTAPPACPKQWQVGGLPSALMVDLRPSPAAEPDPGLDPEATVRLLLGPALTSWLLSRSCPDPQ